MTMTNELYAFTCVICMSIMSLLNAIKAIYSSVPTILPLTFRQTLCQQFVPPIISPNTFKRAMHRIA